MTTYSRIEPVDSLFRPEGALLLYARELVRLSVLGEEIFIACESPISTEMLASHLSNIFGDPDESVVEATSRVLAQLVSQGVLREEP